MNTFVVSLGGSIVAPAIDKIDIVFLKKFKTAILQYVKRGDVFVIIVGGGKPCRMWQDAAKKLNVKNADDLDKVGIRATQLNAELVRAIFGKAAYKQVVCDPAQKVSGFKILLGAGYLPGHSTDYDAVVRAKTLGAKTVVNLSNVSYVYDKDPRVFKNAKPLKNISWKQYFAIFGKKWVPGANVPFDQKAAALAEQYGMRVVFLNGANLKNFEQFLQGKGFSGTIIGDN